MKHCFLLIALIFLCSLIAAAQERTASEYAKAHAVPNRQTAITLGLPHACTLSKQHPCVYYGGDINPKDLEENGLSNENTLLIPDSWTYTEVRAPIEFRVFAAFTNNLQTYGIIDPQTANWDFRVGVSEGLGGTDIGNGTGPAQLTSTGRSAFAFEEYELLTKSSVWLPTGNVWFDVEPNCTNENDPDCSNGRYLESYSNGLNGINSKFTVTSNDGMGPTYADFSGGLYSWASWCNDLGVACGDGMSAGLLK